MASGSVIIDHLKKIGTVYMYMMINSSHHFVDLNELQLFVFCMPSL